jgi:Flagellar biosynthesis/type III secretory pathway protein
MDKPSLSSSDISALIDYLLKSKDPATVGLRKILREKKEDGGRFPLQSLDFEEFFVQGKSKEPFNKEERVIIGLEKRVNDLQASIERSKDELPGLLHKSREEGLREGMQKGEAAAYEKAKAEYEKQVDALQKRISSFLAEVEGSKKSIYANAHKILLDLACGLAKKIIQSEVALNPDIILGVIKKSMTYIADRERIIVRVSKDDLETVSGRKDFWVPVGERLESISIETDERIEKGGCIIESNSGLVDARLGVQFEELRDMVEKVWESVSASGPISSDPPPGGPR